MLSCLVASWCPPGGAEHLHDLADGGGVGGALSATCVGDGGGDCLTDPCTAALEAEFVHDLVEQILLCPK
jgi:hypothetical protein